MGLRVCRNCTVSDSDFATCCAIIIELDSNPLHFFTYLQIHDDKVNSDHLHKLLCSAFPIGAQELVACCYCCHDIGRIIPVYLQIYGIRSAWIYFIDYCVVQQWCTMDASSNANAKI